MNEAGRNDPCPCGSGKKYKKCCLASSELTDFTWRKMCRTNDTLVPELLKHSAEHYGEAAIEEAWDEFSLWNDVPMDPETQMELDTVFIPWFVYNWVPDNAEEEESRHLPETPVALSYLSADENRIDPFARRLIEEACSRQYSFFMVTNLNPGRSLTLRDMFLKQEILVLERTASASLQKGAIIFAHVVTLDKTSIMIGCAPVVIPALYANDFIDFREKIEENMSIFGEDILREYDIELRQYYYRIKEELYNRPLPQIANTDGHIMEPTRLYYTLACTPREALDALKTLSLSDENEILEAAAFDEAGELQAIEFCWARRNRKFVQGMDNTILGNIKIDGNQLTIGVNSRERGEAVKRKITRRLGKRASFQHAVIESAEKMLEEAMEMRAAGPSPGVESSDELMKLPEVQDLMKQMAERQWQAWLDERVPALNGETPREAANTSLGRERLEALLLDFERRTDNPQPFDPDIGALREELGMSRPGE